MAISAKVVLSVASLGVVAAAGGGAYLWTQSHAKQEQWAVVQKYCFDCHNRDDLAGDRAFDRLSPDHIAADAETWELAIRKLRGGLMPPAGALRPTARPSKTSRRGSPTRSTPRPTSPPPAAWRCGG